MVHTSSVLVIAGSMRPNRRSPQIAAWVGNIGRVTTPYAFEIQDLIDLNLLLDDEPGIPALGVYHQETTRRWSEKVSASKAVVFVTPQYNWGYPAPLKNAIDHLYREWHGKPSIIVTYGSHGGGKCAQQLRDILTGLNLNLTDAAPGLRLARERIEADDGAVDPEVDFAPQRAEVVEAFRQLCVLCQKTIPNSAL